MTTWTAVTTLPDQEPAEALAEAVEALEPYGVGTWEIEDGSGLYEVGAYFHDAPDPVALAVLAAAHGARDFVISEVPETDWVAHVRRELAPVEAGRFIVHGAHDADKVPADRTGLLIEAAMAFGTGHHGTTLGCLRALDRLEVEGLRPASVADVGCGTAVLAMAAAHLWDVPVIAGDLDPVAVETAKANVAANGLERRIHVEEAAGFDGPRLSAEGPYDLVVANILKGPLMELAPEMDRRVAPGGVLVLSGILVEQVAAVLERYLRFGFNPRHEERIGDWAALTLSHN